MRKNQDCRGEQAVAEVRGSSVRGSLGAELVKASGLSIDIERQERWEEQAEVGTRMWEVLGWDSRLAKLHRARR